MAVGIAVFFACRCLAQLQFSSDAEIDVWEAGVRSTSAIANVDFRLSSDRKLSFNVIWGTSGPVVVGDLSKGGWSKTLTLGINKIGVGQRTTIESLSYEVKLVSVSNDTAIVTIVWTRTDSLTGASQAGTVVIGTINKTAPNLVGPVGDGSKLSSIHMAATSANSTGAGFGSGGSDGAGFSGLGAAQGGHWEQMILHGQWSYVAENGDFVTVGWITYANVWVPDSGGIRNLQQK